MYGLPDEIRVIGQGYAGPIPVPVIIMRGYVLLWVVAAGKNILWSAYLCDRREPGSGALVGRKR